MQNVTTDCEKTANILNYYKYTLKFPKITSELIWKVSSAGKLFDRKEAFFNVIKNVDSIFISRNSEHEKLDISSKLIIEIRELLKNSEVFDELLSLIEKLANDMNFSESRINLDTQESNIIEKYELSKIDYSIDESNLKDLEIKKENLSNEIQKIVQEEKRIEGSINQITNQTDNSNTLIASERSMLECSKINFENFNTNINNPQFNITPKQISIITDFDETESLKEFSVLLVSKNKGFFNNPFRNNLKLDDYLCSCSDYSKTFIILNIEYDKIEINFEELSYKLNKKVEIYLISNKKNINNIKVKGLSNKIQFTRKISTSIENSIEILRKVLSTEHLKNTNSKEIINLAKNNLEKIDKYEGNAIKRITKNEINIQTYNKQIKEETIYSLIDELKKLKDSKAFHSNKLKELENAIGEKKKSLEEGKKLLDNLQMETSEIYSQLRERKVAASKMDPNEFYLNYKLKEFKNHVMKSRDMFLKIFRLLKLILTRLETFDYQKIKTENLIDDLKTLIFSF